MSSSRHAAAALLATLLLFLVPAAAFAEASITLDFVRHGEAGDSLVINNMVPGPPLTDVGEQQANAIADVLKGYGIDAIYTSGMTRAVETADPLATLLGLPVSELSGLNEIDAGVFAGLPVNVGGLPLGAVAYALTPFLWTLGLPFVPQPGSFESGMEFQDRFSDAVQTIYAGSDGGATDAVFSHEASIAIWTLMNVDNPDFALIFNQALTTGELLPYTGMIEVQGSPEDGWTLVSWDGVAVPQDPGLLTELLVDVRDFITAPQMAAYHVWEAILTGDSTVVMTAIQTGLSETGSATLQFPLAVIHDIVDAFGGDALMVS